jgi:hypothetical protein
LLGNRLLNLTLTINSEYRERIRKWLFEYDKFVVNDRDDVVGENFDFSFWIWSKKGGKAIPLIVGYLKDPKDSILIGWGWEVDKSHDVVKDVINDPDKTLKFVQSLKMAIDSKKYRIEFIPDEKSLDGIKVNRQYRIDSLTKENLENEIFQVWLQYGFVLLSLQVASGRPFVP